MRSDDMCSLEIGHVSTNIRVSSNVTASVLPEKETHDRSLTPLSACGPATPPMKVAARTGLVEMRYRFTATHFRLSWRSATASASELSASPSMEPSRSGKSRGSRWAITEGGSFTKCNAATRCLKASTTTVSSASHAASTRGVFPVVQL